MNRKQIEQENKESGKILGLMLKINVIAIVLILSAYVLLNIF